MTDNYSSDNINKHKSSIEQIEGSIIKKLKILLQDLNSIKIEDIDNAHTYLNDDLGKKSVQISSIVLNSNKLNNVINNTSFLIPIIISSGSIDLFKDILNDENNLYSKIEEYVEKISKLNNIREFLLRLHSTNNKDADIFKDFWHDMNNKMTQLLLVLFNFKSIPVNEHAINQIKKIFAEIEDLVRIYIKKLNTLENANISQISQVLRGNITLNI